MSLWNLFRRKPVEPVLNTEQLMIQKADELSELWKKATAEGLKIRPWVEWENKEVNIVESYWTNRPVR